MPTNLHAMIRYRVIDHSLRRKGRLWTWQALAQACGEELREQIRSDLPNPAERTIKGDIINLRNGRLGIPAPIIYDRSQRSYRYEDPEFSISNSPLTPDDVEEMQHALVILKQFQGFSQFEGIRNIITKLESTVHLRAGRTGNIVQVDAQTYEPGTRWLDPLYRAIARKQTFTIKYHPFTLEPFTADISPCLLREFNNRWFLIAWNHVEKLIRNYPLDRIKAITPATRKYHTPKSFNPDNYFQHVYGVSIPDDGKVTEVRFSATLNQAQYIETKPIHPTQHRARIYKDRIVFTIHVIPNYELESLFLSFGEKVKLIKPVSLKRKIKKRLEKSWRQYARTV